MAEARPRILLVEDDAHLVELLSYNLRAAGFDVVSTGSGEEALLLAAERTPDLVLLDWMLDDLSGIEVCRRLRRAEATASLPILMLTARSTEEDRIRGLETGADDYLVKPFSPRELVARMRALLRRLRPALFATSLDYGGLVMDMAAHRVERDGCAIHLGPTEFRLLRHFLEQPERVFSRERLLDSVWGHDSEVELRTVDVHIRRLRQALNAGGLPDLIRTVRSAGYALQRGSGASLDGASA